MVNPDMYFGDDFGQKIDLTVRIREILRNYPEGTSIFKEMVQNADDAGATEVNLCLDYRQHATTELAYEKLGSFQGPSLLVHNNATFTDADFQSIQRIGDSLKKDNSKGWKTGRFGVGFNSVYHVTDLPSFVSGSQLVFFDPQACHLPNVNPSNPGKIIDYIAHPDLVNNFPDQISPFQCFGCNFAEPFSGTIFRLALRTIEQAQRSKLSDRAQTPAQMAEMLEEFACSLPTVLLFLRNVCKISVWEWRVGEEIPTILQEALLDNTTSEIKAKRSLQHATLASSGQPTQKFTTEGIFCDYPLKIVARDCTANLSKEYEYLIMNQLGGGECSKIACNPANVDQRLVPWGGVAVSTAVDSESCATTSGLAFCFLPLPTHTYLPVHVNGYFELSSNRRDIWFGEGLSGEGLLRAQWNIALLRDVIAPCYVRAILHLTNDLVMAPEQHVKLFPHALPPAPWDSLTHAFLSLIRSKPCLYSDVGGGRWVSPTQSMVVRSSCPNSNQLKQLMIDDDFPIVRNLAEELERVLVKTKTIPSYVEPQAVREAYKTKHSVHAGDQEATKCLLGFMLSDLKLDTLNALVDVNFLPVADGTLRTFESRPKVDSSELKYLCSMGFSRLHAVYALAVAGENGAETALNWLLQNPNPSAVCGERASTLFLIPSSEELSILDKARGHLVNIEVMNESMLNLLLSDAAGKLLNVQKLDYQGFDDMLAVILPAAWFGKRTVPWTEKTDGQTPNVEWFRQLWKYIGTSKHLAAYKDKWPIVPTSSNTLVQLSLSAGVLSAELIPEGCLRCLEKLQVRILLPKLFATFQPNPDIWQYIHQPTAVGVLSCIEAIIGADGSLAMSTRVNELFAHTDRSDREDLLTFLASAVIEDIGVDLKHICCNLPIFPGFRNVSHIEQLDVGWVSGDEDLDNTDSGFSPTFVSVAEIDARHKEPLLCVGMAPKFLDDNFVFVREGDTLLLNLLSHLGVRRISKVEMFAKFLIPRFDCIEPKARVKFVYELLVELTALLAQDSDGILLHIIETAAIFPTMTGELKSIDDLYDPEVDEFMEIMDDSFFPAIELQDSQPLSALRSIGLQRTLSRRSILSLAVSLEHDQMKILAANSLLEHNTELDEMCEKLRARSFNFFQYVDAHMSQLVTPIPLQRQAQTYTTKVKKKSRGIRFLRNFLGDDRSRVLDTENGERVPTAETQEEQAIEHTEIEDFKAKLAIIMWIPVREEKPHPIAPWLKHGERIIVASPQQSRPIKHLWLCSSQYHIIKCSVQSEVLRTVLGWEKRLPIDTIAFQLKEISLIFDKRKSQIETDLSLKVDNDGDTHVVWSAVYNIYQLLSQFFEAEQGGRRDQVLRILSGNGKYVWVGDRFVSASHVATVAVVNAEPYMYTVPNELLHFRPFLRAIGVRERFALADYVHVLGAMHKECLAGVTTRGSDVNAVHLSGDKLALVIGLVQLISDTLQHHSDYELFAPDRNGVLEFAANLTFDDAPWLDKRDYETCSGSTRFIHPKISNEVAAKIGCCSLRSQLLNESGHEAMSFGGEGNVEVFGQTEALTKRIAHILEQYPDGPNIFSELIQNADDAGATRVCVLYNSCSYGTSSLLSPAMAKWQGPSLFCYNDAEFSDRDFINLARIGQASKLQRAATTGRFGLGFNSVYHFTDLPSIVSAKSIVMFDPHATHLPGISAANPGIKICFANSSIVKQFPDQFAPFKGVFGCDLEHHYRGTLFRFPLRNSSLAECSEIKRRGYSHHEIVELFKSFQESIVDLMLFLRNVRTVEVYLQSETNQPPMLLYSAEVPEVDRGESWRKIDRFMRNDELVADEPGMTELFAKREFYARLRSTPTDELPSVTQVLHVRRRQQKELANLFRQFDVELGCTGAETVEADQAYQVDETIEKYLVCNQIGGGKAREMACAAANESLKLIPWVGIASRIDGVPVDGRAFCFLPLPVRVGLPVHINGYFELSSNRRDIWIGDDMSGDGKLRSEWNANLLVDAVAPAYLTFLLEARAMFEKKPSQYLSFFPTKMPACPWDSIALELFRIMKDRPMFFASKIQLQSNTSAEISRKIVAPSSCVLVDDSLTDCQTLEIALGAASLVTVHVPMALRSLLIQLDAVYGVMTPALFRQLTGQGDFLPTLDANTLQRVVKFCLSDCQSSSNSLAETLSQLPLLPLKDGKFGKICFNDESLRSNELDWQSKKQQLNYVFASAIEEQLLADFPHRVVRREFKELFDQLPFVYEYSNLSVVDLKAILANFLPHVLSHCWSKPKEDVFTIYPSSQVENKKDWIRLLWKYAETQLQTVEQLPEAITKWPLIPIMCEDENQWLCLSANVSLVLPHSEAPVLSSDILRQLRHTLAKVGIYVMNTAYVAGGRSAQWLLARKYAHKLTSNGLLAALSRYQLRHNRQSFDELFAATTSDDRQVLCDFFSQNTFDAISNDFQPILFELPIFSVHDKPVLDATSTRHDDNVQFVSLRRGGYLPDTGADARILDDSFFRVEKEATRRFLRDCGIEELTYATILLDHVFPQLPVLERHDGNLVDSVIISALETLSFHQRNDTRFREFISTHAIIPSRKRNFRAVNQLHDPSVSELSELVGENSLPAHAFSTSLIVNILRPLGLRTGLSCHAVLESARSIEAMYREDGDELADRASHKAQSLLTIVNKHFDSMMLASSSSDCTADEETENSEKEAMQEIMTALKEVQWLPVLSESPEPAMPWKSSTKSSHRVRLSRASDTRPLKDAWFCSSSMNILDGELMSQELISEFGWNEQIDPVVIAKQLEAIGSLWEEYCRKKDTKPLLSSPSSNWRFPSSEVYLMYGCLERYRMSDEEGWLMTPLYRKLMDALWICTGKEFACPRQFAAQADANLEPLLYCCPREHIIPRSLLASFGIRDTFSTVDYLEATMRLPRNAALSEKEVVACLKIFELLAEDTLALESALKSFVLHEMVLMDQTNQLIPAVQLTFDDMKWNESQDIRRGIKFVSERVPETVSRLLGATSLHLKLAQTTVTSQPVVCPAADALHGILPSPSEWHHALLWETILAAERLGGTQVDFFLDSRHHSSQRVIEPSLQPLQDEALCIHIHDVVLSESDINNLFHQEPLRAGLLCGFIASDCMQILSGKGFYILDPTGCYLSTHTTIPASDRAACIGRRYEVRSQDFLRYPDQLLPFTALPSCPSNVSRGTQSTLLRFPWRKKGSDVSSYVLDSREAENLITFLKLQLFQTLIFTESVHRISLWSVGKESEFAFHCHGYVSLDAPESTLRKRNMTRQNQEWKKKFSLQSFFKNPVIPENKMEFIVDLELENRHHRDTWLFADNNGWGRSRDLACTPVHEMLHSTPYVSVACHILRDSNPAPRLRGSVYEIINTGQLVGLPVHINGCFKRATNNKNLALTVSFSQVGGRDDGGVSGSDQQLAAVWNRVLVEDGLTDAYMRLLMAAKRYYASRFPKALYNIWPTLQKRRGEKQLGTLLQTHTYHSIGMRELFLCTDGIFRALSGGYQLDFGGINIQVASFAQLHFPALDVPTRILQDCLRLLPSSIYSVTPKVMRRFLKSESSFAIHSDVCLSLLEYCLSDLPFPLPSETDPVWAELHGLCLLPLEDGSIGVLRINQRRTNYVLASFNQVELLRPLGHLFVSVVASQRLHKFFSDTRFTSVFGLASFSIKILSDNIEKILPSAWKNQAIVQWDPKSPIGIDQLWLYRFWQVVNFERRSLEYFANWPLIPVKGSRLVSCSKMDMAICVWDGSADSKISAEVAEVFQASGLQQEKKMDEVQAEHKRLMELSSARFKTDDEVAESSSSDEEERGGENGDEDNGEIANDDEMASVSDDSSSSATTHLSIMEDIAPQNQDRSSSLGGLPANEDASEEMSLSPDSTLLSPVTVSDDDEANVDDVETAEALAVFVSTVEDESHEFCSRETLHEVLFDLNVAMMELAYFGQKRDIVPSSADVGLVVLDGIFASVWENLRWEELGEARAVLLAEFFSHYGNTSGGYNRVQLGKLKQLPIFVTICDTLCAIGSGLDFFLIPPDLNLTDIPLPPDAQKCFLKSNSRLNAFYQELGVEEMSNSKLLMYVLPMYEELLESQRNQILRIILQKWQSLRGNAELITLLKTSSLFQDGTSYRPASFFCDPRNSVLATIYDGVSGRFPAQCYRTSEWLDFMGEIGLQTEVTVDIFVECARRIDEQCSTKQALSTEDEHLTTTLHHYFVQNFDKFDRSRSFFDQIKPLAFVPAVVYDTSDIAESAQNVSGQFKSRSVVRKYSECAISDDQALAYSTMPILASVAQPPRVLYSRLGIRSPPPQDKVVAHLLCITNSNRALSSRPLDWQFFLPMVEVFQAVFKFLQENWRELEVETQRRLIAAAVIPVGSISSKGLSLILSFRRKFGSIDV
ncbi:unnamed protein product [Peronospora belbahrii]|uniref:UBA domain-containing protein n=1 Tax=Peronospora belbahrii TaxID=622444 RepID=A0ABN8CVN0_9STRA|nr:unnamed protein product [Peronospora belbahrii]